VLRRDTWPDLVRLGWPISATLLVRITMRTVDILVVGIAVGAVGVAALGIGDTIARLVLFTGLGLGAGAIATVSQATGRRDHQRVAVATTHACVLALLLGVPFAVAGWLWAEEAFGLLGADPDVVRIGGTYLRIVLASAPARMLAIVLTRAYQGTGDTRTPLVVRGLGTLLNIGLTVLLVPGLLGLPALGVEGAAVATAIGNVVSAGALSLVAVLRSGGPGFTLAAFADLRPAGRILRIAAPQILERNLFALGALPLNAITLALGTNVNAGLQVGQRVVLYGLLPSRGAATAASSRAGNALGAGRFADAEHVVRGGLSLAFTVAAPVALATLVLAAPIAGLFVSEPEAVAAATTWVRVFSLALLLRSFYGVFRGAFEAGGDTRPPLVASTLGIGVGQVFLAWFLGLQLGLGLPGVAIGVLVDPVLRTAVLWRLFERGTWQRELADQDATPADELDPEDPDPEDPDPPEPDERVAARQ